MDSDTGVKKTFVSEVFNEKDKMLFHFDYGEDWMFVVMCETIEKTSNRKKKPEVLEIAGKFPEQYPSRENCEKDVVIGINPKTGERFEIHLR